MEFRAVTFEERDRVAVHHPVLSSTRPDLTIPAFEANPVPASGNFPYLFYAEDEDRIVGSRKAMPDQVSIAGQKQDWAWNFDAFIDPAYRGQSIGQNLFAFQTDTLRKLGFINGAAFSAAAVMHIYQRLGFQIVGHAPRMTLVRNTRPFLQKRLHSNLMLNAASTLTNMAVSAQSTLRRTVYRTTRFEVHPLGEMDFRRLLQNVKHLDGNYWAQDATWTTSRMQPADTLYQVTRAHDKEPCAVFVLRNRVQRETLAGGHGRNTHRLTLMDFFLLDADDGVPGVLAAALALLLERLGADVADIVTSCPRLLGALRQRGFQPRGPGMSFAYLSPENEQLGANLSDWHLTHSCSDGYTFR